MLALIENISYSVFRKEGEFLKVEEDVFSYSVKEMKGHDDVIPCIRERCFDYVFSNNNKFIAFFLIEVLSLDIVINESDIVKLSNNMEVKHKKDKYHRLDNVVDSDKIVDAKEKEELQLDKELACKESFQDGAKQIAKNLLSQNIDTDIIMKSTGLSLEKINLLRS